MSENQRCSNCMTIYECLGRHMNFAYADPPYLGCGHLYPEHPESRVWNDLETHQRLIERLVDEFPDGWAMSMSTPSLRLILPLCPGDIRIGSWVKTFVAFKRGVRPCYAWEPVVFWKGRNPPLVRHDPPPKNGKQTTPKDFVITEADTWLEWQEWVAPVIPHSITLKKGLTGAKPEKFCHWVLDLLNVRPGDTVTDLYPGTGIMGLVADERTTEQLDGRLPVAAGARE